MMNGLTEGYLGRRIGGLLVAASFAVLDFTSKAWALQADAVGALPMWLNRLGFGPGELGFAFAWNRGMSFSLLNNVAWGPWVLGGVAVAACIWFVHWLGEKVTVLHQVGLGMLIGGAVGNVLDRVQHGAVVDFLLLNPRGLFPYTFNVADMAITFGVLLLLLDGLLEKPVDNGLKGS